MDLELIKDNLVVDVYQIDSNKKAPLHKLPDRDEVFYCINGSGYGVLKDSKIELTVGKVFIVPAGTLHSHEIDPQESGDHP